MDHRPTVQRGGGGCPALTWSSMAIELNHTIVPATDRWVSAQWLSEILGLDAPRAFGHFTVVQVGATSLDYVDHDGERAGPRPGLHFAFLVGEDEFDAIFARLSERAITYYADPRADVEGDINTNDGGRGCYFADPDGHWMEILTVPYGGWAPAATATTPTTPTSG